MQKSNLIASLFLMLITTYGKAQNAPGITFNYPKSKMGNFAKVWFEAVNSYDKNKFIANTSDREWDEFFNIILDLSKKNEGWEKKGIQPDIKTKSKDALHKALSIIK